MVVAEPLSSPATSTNDWCGSSSRLKRCSNWRAGVVDALEAAAAARAFNNGEPLNNVVLEVNSHHQELTIVNVANIVVEGEGSLGYDVLRMVGEMGHNLSLLLLVGVDGSHVDRVRHRRSLRSCKAMLAFLGLGSMYGGKRPCTLLTLRWSRHARGVFCVVTAPLVSYNLCPIKEKCFWHASGILRVNLRAVKQHGH